MSTTTTVITEPSAVLSGAGVYLLAKLLKEPPVAACIRGARWLHGPDFAATIRAINAAGDAWQTTAELPQRGDALRSVLPATDCATMNTERAAEHLDLGIRRVQELAKSGRITGSRVGGRWQLDKKSVNIYQRRHQQDG